MQEDVKEEEDDPLIEKVQVVEEKKEPPVGLTVSEDMRITEEEVKATINELIH